MKNFAGPFLAIVAAGALGIYLLRQYVQNYQVQQQAEADLAVWKEVSAAVDPLGYFSPFLSSSEAQTG